MKISKKNTVALVYTDFESVIYLQIITDHAFIASEHLILI